MPWGFDCNLSIHIVLVVVELGVAPVLPVVALQPQPVAIVPPKVVLAQFCRNYHYHSGVLGL